jgi:hypothetical protein
MSELVLRSPLAPEPGTEVVFVHIPKTAGTTLGTILRRHYGAGFARINTSGADDPAVLRERARATAARPGLRAAQGHITLGVSDVFPEEARFGTILRDPVERTLSEYHHLVTRVGKWRHGWLPAPSPALTLEDGLGARKYIPDNLQTRMLCGLASIHDPLPADALEWAKDNLSSRFAYVGTTERFDEFLAVLNVELGWPTVAYEPVRVGSGRPRRGDLTAADARLVEEANTLDRELYEHAAGLFQRSLDSAGEELEAELEVLREAKQALRDGASTGGAVLRVLPAEARVHVAVREWQLIRAEEEIHALAKQVQKLTRAKQRLQVLKKELRRRTLKGQLERLKAKVG